MKNEFDVKIEVDDFGETWLILHNGLLWPTIRIDNPISKIPQIVEVLQRHHKLIECDTTVLRDFALAEVASLSVEITDRRCSDTNRQLKKQRINELVKHWKFSNEEVIEKIRENSK